jgi:hypothetical protein
MATIAATGATFKNALIIISSWCGFDQPRSPNYVVRDGRATPFTWFEASLETGGALQLIASLAMTWGAVARMERSAIRDKSIR